MLLVQGMIVSFENAAPRFQYIICCWFKKFLDIKPQSQFCFNTLYVVGSTKGMAKIGGEW